MPTDTHWRSPLVTLRAPEWVFAMYAFLMHFAWEMLQTPFFSGMSTMEHWPATLLCLKATLGDVVIALAAMNLSGLALRDRGWFLAPEIQSLSVYLCVGLACTIALELHALWTGRWAYSSMMPTVPGLGVGLVPLLQWIVIPLATAFVVRRHHLGVR